MSHHIYLTGDRPTGKLHIGHMVGSLNNRVRIQNIENADMTVLIADLQALTDHAKEPQMIKKSIISVTKDYLAVGIDPAKTTIAIQSCIPALLELPMYYANLVTMARLKRNPTIKTEIAMRGFQENIPVGFMTYPISQAADITAFKADRVPVGEDQLPMLEQCREIVVSFNREYNTDALVIPAAVLPDNESCFRLPGIDGAKMSKSLGNAIYLSDSPDIVREKVMKMYTDPNHLHVNDPGNPDNPVFQYLEVFSREEHFRNTPKLGYENLQEMKEHYARGGLGDVKVKRFLADTMIQDLEPIYERRMALEGKEADIVEILREGTRKAVEVTNQTLEEVREAIGVRYF